MKHVCLAASLMLFVAATVWAQDVNKDKPATESAKTIKLICPVTGEDADPDVTYDHDGKTYSFCCEGCVAKFKKDPVKYIKASAKKNFDPCDHAEGNHDGHAHEAVAPAGDEAKGVINTGKDFSDKIVNTMCPVMNEEVDKKVTTVSYKGDVYGFCCKSCIKKFAENPEKYLKKN